MNSIKIIDVVHYDRRYLLKKKKFKKQFSQTQFIASIK